MYVTSARDSRGHGSDRPASAGIFIIEGAATCAIALIACWLLPNSLEKAKFLSEDDRDFAGEPCDLYDRASSAAKMMASLRSQTLSSRSQPRRSTPPPVSQCHRGRLALRREAQPFYRISREVSACPLAESELECRRRTVDSRREVRVGRNVERLCGPSSVSYWSYLHVTHRWLTLA